jgi:hypothetical protein
MKDGRGGKWANAALQRGYSHHHDCMPHNEYVAWQRQCLTEMMRLIPSLIDQNSCAQSRRAMDMILHG